VCAGEAFQWFTAHLLARLAEFRASITKRWRVSQAYTSAAFHTRAELAEEGTCWKPRCGLDGDGPRRRRLWPGPPGTKWRFPIGSRGGQLPLRADGHAGRAVERLLELQRGGVRIRSERW